jgi:uncharacterized protein (TIGR02118 family)
MIKLVTFQKRANSLTRSEFEHRWQTIHGPMAAQFPGLRGYMLGFSIEPDEPQADGIAQLWFDSRESCQASYASEIGRSGSADAIKYLGRREHMLLSESWILRGGSLAKTPYKLVVAGKRIEGRSRNEFCEWWPHFLSSLPEESGALSTRVSIDEKGQLLNSQTGGDLGLVVGEGVYDGLIEAWFANIESLDSAIKLVRTNYSSLLRDHLSKFETAALREEIVVRPPAEIYCEV